jgi:hypothetical protein
MVAKKRTKIPDLLKPQIQIRERLQKRFQNLRPIQADDLVVAYHTALGLAVGFSEKVTAFTQVINQEDLNCKCRSGNGIKNPARILEKAYIFENGSSRTKIPLDFLGGKIIAPTLKRIYEIAQYVSEHFTVQGFNDRFETPEKSGYRDLQFHVEIANGHIAELKIVHRAIDELDAIEHRIYEIRRMLSTKKELNESETKVYDSLVRTTEELYADTWQSILNNEVRK